MRQGVMLCYPLEEKRLLSYPKPWLCQPKLDGVRARWDPSTKQLLSSQGNIFTSVPHITEQLQNYQYALDGELYSSSLSFEETVSRVKRTVYNHKDSEAIHFYTFDIISEAQQTDRLDLLYATCPIATHIHTVLTYSAFHLNDIMEYFDLFLTEGFEGIIVRNPKGLYKPSRSINIMKYKPRQQDIVEVLDKEEERDIHGEPKGRLGSLLCQTQQGNIFSVGTGFNHDERKRYWTEPLPSKVAILYQNLTANGVPRFPVYKGFVNDTSPTTL